MKTKLFLFTAIIAISQIVIAQKSCYELVWSDEFEGNALNLSTWNIEVNDNGGGNNELQYYTARPENLRVENGNLVIEARKEVYLTRQYTSARITTQQKKSFTYGRIEARMKLPYGKGIWPAFWMLGESISSVGWPNCGEIDIMEMVGGGTNDAITHFTLHWGPSTSTGHPSYGKSYKLPSGILADDYHVFAVEWDKNKITGWIDNVQYFVMNITDAGLEAFHKNFFIILNLAVGGNWPGNPDNTTVFPQKMYVDYVRVYKKTADYSFNGKTEVMENESNLTYTINDYSDSLQYRWILPLGVSKMSEEADKIQLKWGCNSDTLKLVVKGKCDSSVISKVVSLKKPKISGKQWVNEGATNLTYQVDSLPGATFIWESTDGINLVGGTNSSRAMVNVNKEGWLKVKVTTSCNEYADSINIRFGDGQFPYPDANKPNPIPGTIVAANFDAGGEGIAYHDVDKGNKGGIYRTNEDVDLESYDNSYTIGWFDYGEWVEYTIQVAETGTYRGTFRVASQTGGGSFSVYVDNQLIANRVKVGATGGWSTFQSISVDTLKFTEGIHVLKVLSYGGFNLGKMTFTKLTDVESAETEKFTLDIYPNPAINEIFIRLSSNITANCAVYNMHGQLINSFKLENHSTPINVSAWEKGIYCFVVSTNTETFRRKILIQ